MEKLTQKWAVLSFLEDIEEGAVFHYTDFPLHVTLAGVFAVEKTGYELAEELKRLLANRSSFVIEADEKAMFGAHEDISVMKIKKNTDLMSLYSDIYKWLENAGATYNSPEYQGAGYAPHSTFQKKSSLKPGEKRLLESVSLIDLFPNNNGHQRKIFKTIHLG